jgi:hypothetical protein
MFAGLAVILGLLGTLYMYAGDEARPDPLGITAVRGDVSLEHDGETTAAKVGRVLERGDRVRTGENGVAVISRGGRSPIRLTPSTEVGLVSVDDEVVELELERGRVRAKVRPDAGAVRLTSRARSVLATDADLSMAITPDGDLSVQSDRGVLSISGVAGAHKIANGQRLRALADGTSSVGPVPAELLLKVQWPAATRERVVEVGGETEPASMVEVTSSEGVKPAKADAQGRFSLRVPLTEGENTLDLLVTDAFGKQRIARGTVTRETEEQRYKVDVKFGR